LQPLRAPVRPEPQDAERPAQPRSGRQWPDEPLRPEPQRSELAWPDAAAAAAAGVRWGLRRHQLAAVAAEAAEEAEAVCRR
jgi:hypothetical protein